jgi:hypothetical protein
MSPSIEACVSSKPPNEQETRERRVLDQQLARIAREIESIVRLIGATAGDDLAFTSTHDPVVELFTAIETADRVAKGLAARAGVSSASRSAAKSARAALELSRIALTVAIARGGSHYEE